MANVLDTQRQSQPVFDSTRHYAPEPCHLAFWIDIQCKTVHRHPSRGPNSDCSNLAAVDPNTRETFNLQKERTRSATQDSGRQQHAMLQTPLRCCREGDWRLAIGLD